MKLYDAIMSLGRAITEIDVTGWCKGEPGHADTEKCAVGHVTYALASDPCMMDEFRSHYSLVFPTAVKVLWALARAFPVERHEELLKVADYCDMQANGGRPICTNRIKAVINGTAHPAGRDLEVETFVVLVNDRLMLTHYEVKQWFSDAIDVLAKELPIPAPPIDTHVVVEERELVLA